MRRNNKKGIIFLVSGRLEKFDNLLNISKTKPHKNNKKKSEIFVEIMIKKK